MKRKKFSEKCKTLQQNRKVSNFILLYSACPLLCDFLISPSFPSFFSDRCWGTHCFKSHLLKSLPDALILSMASLPLPEFLMMGNFPVSGAGRSDGLLLNPPSFFLEQSQSIVVSAFLWPWSNCRLERQDHANILFLLKKQTKKKMDFFGKVRLNFRLLKRKKKPLQGCLAGSVRGACNS